MTRSNLMKNTDSSQNGYKTLRKGEIACYEQFLLFPQCFRKISTADTYKDNTLLAKQIVCKILPNTKLRIPYN